MNGAALAEANGVLNNILNALLGIISGQKGSQPALAKNLIGVLQTNAKTQILAASVGTQLFNCFEQVRLLGATRVQMDSVRTLMLGLSPAPVTIPGVALAFYGIYFSLVEQAQIIAATNFTSREDVDQLLYTMNNAFDPVEEFAADATDDPTIYQQLIALHSTITADLVARARPLPQMIQYSFPIRMPSLQLSQRLYSVPTHANDLVAENKVVHPAFCLASGRALSA